MAKVISMEPTDNAKKKVGDGYETLRVKSELKVRILKMQNDYFAKTSRKISVNELIREALDAREGKHVAPKRKHA